MSPTQLSRHSYPVWGGDYFRTLCGGGGLRYLRHDRLPTPVVDVAHEVVQVVDGVETHARLRLESPERLGQVVLLAWMQRNGGVTFRNEPLHSYSRRGYPACILVGGTGWCGGEDLRDRDTKPISLHNRF